MLTTNRRNALLLLAAAGAASAGAKTLRPTEYLAQTLGPINLERTMPRNFGTWVTDTVGTAALINPAQEALINKIYSDILTRTYKDEQTGYRIMMSVAYGEDQSDSLALHYPDVCYPSQGFSVKSKENIELQTSKGSIPVRRLVTSLGDRHEPVTYWVTIGNRTVRSGTARKALQLRYSLAGIIPDGLLFRISSIDRATESAFKRQEEFVRSVVLALPNSAVGRLTGLS